MIAVDLFRDRAVALFGLGGSGLATAEALAAGGAHLRVWDDAEAARSEAARRGLEVVALGEVTWRELEALVLAPGVPLTHPEPHWTVRLAHAAHVPVVGDVEPHDLAAAARLAD